MKRFLGPLLLILLLAGVGAGIYFSVSDIFAERSILTVRGLVSSDKEAFFNDPRVVAALEEGGFKVEFEKAGSRQIATRPDLNQFDFAFPAGVPAVQKIMDVQPGADTHDVFYTPMAIATWEPIFGILEANGVASKQGQFNRFNVEAYLKLVSEGKRWKDLNGAGAYPAVKSFLITSADVRKANSAAMYLALASYVMNDYNVVLTNEDVQKVQPLMNDLFLKQGYSEYGTEVSFDDFLSMGMGKSPMVIIYESQLIYQATRPGGALPGDVVLMYPDPIVFSKHVLVGLTPNGDKFGEFLRTDPTMQQLEIEHGYRNGNTAYFQQFKTQFNLTSIPDSFVNVIDPPSYEVLEKMIGMIENQYK